MEVLGGYLDAVGSERTSQHLTPVHEAQQWLVIPRR